MKYIITETQYKILSESLEFDKIYKETYPKMFRSVCMKYADGDYELADEFCQIGYIRVYEKLHTFRGEGSLEGWIRLVLSSSILDELRKRKSMNVSLSNFESDDDYVDILNIPDDEDYDDTLYMGKYSEKDIRNAIKSLPDKYRFVFYQYYFNKKTHPEIAKMMGIKPMSSRSQLSRAKDRIKEYLEKLDR